MAAPDFSKIFASNSPLTPYVFPDSDYLEGWNFIGSTPPAREMMDTWMRTADTKMQFLNDNLFSPSLLGGYLFWRLASTAYFVGDKRTLKNGPVDIYIECVTAGMSAATDLNQLPEGTSVGDTFSDGTVVWHVLQFADTENAGLNLLKRNRTYAVGDIAYSANLPSWARLECVTAGTTAATEPDFLSVSKAGVYITDGSVLWIVDDVRDGSRVGDIIIRPTLRDGLVKANGATLTASEYPRLLHYAQDNSLIVTATVYATDCSKYVYDSAADTLQVPNMTGRVLQGGDMVKSIEAGLPNITASFCASIRVTYETASAGAVSDSYLGRKATGGNEVYYNDYLRNFDASKSSTIYGASTTVQPPALQLIPQIKY